MASDGSSSERFVISSDPSLVDSDVVASFLTNDSYWAAGRPVEVIKKSIENSACFGAYTAGGAQAGFARLVTDYATFGWVCDVFVLPAYRGSGIGKMLMERVVTYADDACIGHLILATADAHGLYGQNGFAVLAEPAKWMNRVVRLAGADLAES